MSFNALAWAAKQKPGNLAAKMVLLALANYADAADESWPATATIAEFGGMNRKTVVTALDRLEDMGLIEGTGKKVGKSGQIKVYKLSVERQPKTGCSQKREAPEFSGKASQKRDTDTVKEPISSEAKASSDKRARPANPFPMPDGVDPQHWADFLANRKRKRRANTATAHQELMEAIATFSDSEWPPGRLIKHAAAKGWAVVCDPHQDNFYDRSRRHHSARDEFQDPLVRAILAGQAERAARPASDAGGDAGGWPEYGD